MEYTFEQLRGFVAVADELHFGRAAARLRMTQPPLSRQIQKLERVVGAQLLERDNRHVTLTAAGQAFLIEARRLLSLAASAPELARRVSSGASGVVRLGFTSTSTYGILGRLLNTLSDALPNVDLDLFEMVTREQTAALLNEEIDLGLARPSFDTETFESRLLHREPLLVAVPQSHRLLEMNRPVTGADLSGESVIMHSPNKAKYFYDLIAGLVPVSADNTVHPVSQVLTMLWLVAGGRGVALVPASASRLHIDGVSFVPLRTPVPEPVELHLLWTKKSKNPALWRVLSVLEAHLAST